MPTEDQASCPCGSAKPFYLCCEPFLIEQTQPSSAEQLMRSRYTAYVTLNSTYLLNTWHPDTRPKNLSLSQDIIWKGLEVVDVRAGGKRDDTGEVSFNATFTTLEGIHRAISERSFFKKLNRKWYYVAAIDQNAPIIKTGRNQPCPCGSGLKYKKCCGR